MDEYSTMMTSSPGDIFGTCLGARIDNRFSVRERSRASLIIGRRGAHPYVSESIIYHEL
jgi:hypothetical protein